MPERQASDLHVASSCCNSRRKPVDVDGSFQDAADKERRQATQLALLAVSVSIVSMIMWIIVIGLAIWGD